MGLASLPGKLAEYVDLEREGLTAIELDVKDENGQVGFNASSLKLAREVGATRDFYDARERRQARPRSRPVPDRSDRRLRGPGALARSAATSPFDEATARSGKTPRGSAGRTRTTVACGSTTSISPSRRRRPGSTRSCSTTCGSRPTVMSTEPCTPIDRRACARTTRLPRSCGTPATGWSRSAYASRPRCSGSRRCATWASARFRGAWLRTSTPCTR